MVPSLPLLSCESSVSVKENPDRKKKKKIKSWKISNFIVTFISSFFLSFRTSLYFLMKSSTFFVAMLFLDCTWPFCNMLLAHVPISLWKHNINSTSLPAFTIIIFILVVNEVNSICIKFSGRGFKSHSDQLSVATS